MKFNETISCLTNNEAQLKRIHRRAVRAVIIQNDKLLMVRSKLGYYKLPGGGVEKGESDAEALVREVAEETGYLHCKVEEEFGLVSELRPDQKKRNTCFHMDSYHYLCTLGDGEQHVQSLVAYEAEEEYAPVWISPEVAFHANEAVYNEDPSRSFIPRENFVLKWIIKK